MIKTELIKKGLKKTKTDELGIMYNLISDEMEERKVFDAKTVELSDIDSFMETADDIEIREIFESLDSEFRKRQLGKLTNLQVE